MHVVVSGGTGFIGEPLVEHLLGLGHSVTVVSRSPDKVARVFDGRAPGCKIDDLPASFDAVINLAGATLDKRWSAAWKREMIDSRVETTRILREGAENSGAKVFISSSAVGYYGDCGDEVCNEDHAPGDDFLAGICVKWEQAAQTEKLRLVIVRTGVVLHHSGGVLGATIPLFKWFMGGRLGDGRQYMSWVHRDDIVRLFAWALENESVSGVLNGTAPEPCTNREFTRALARGVHRPVSLPVPRFALRLALGQMCEMVLHGQKVLPARPLALGFEFEHTGLTEALESAIAG
ncbi:MAG: TIGR01777 family oxidoreductase [Planctomycetes bacterium]|nr:TIGR01777 family oxidoreductase [Planctomycetota bacterium]